MQTLMEIMTKTKIIITREEDNLHVQGNGVSDGISDGVSDGQNDEAGRKMFDASVMPKLKSHIKFKLQDKDWQNAKMLSKQPKRTGVNKDWMNIHVDGEESPTSINWKDITEWVEVEGEEVVLFLTADSSR